MVYCYDKINIFIKKIVSFLSEFNKFLLNDKARLIKN